MADTVTVVTAKPKKKEKTNVIYKTLRRGSKTEGVPTTQQVARTNNPADIYGTTRMRSQTLPIGFEESMILPDIPEAKKKGMNLPKHQVSRRLQVQVPLFEPWPTHVRTGTITQKLKTLLKRNRSKSASAVTDPKLYYSPEKTKGDGETWFVRFTHVLRLRLN